MKKLILLSSILIICLNAFSQENMFTLGGGYTSANIEDTETKGTGWRINGLFEFNPAGGMFAHGVSVGYIGLTSTEGTGALTIENKIHSVPIYYAPKLMLGNDKIKGFVKGALGLQFAGLERTGFVTINDSDMGFYGGGGAGILIFLSEKFFLNAEYEIAYASNTAFSDGWISTAGGGIGFRF